MIPAGYMAKRVQRPKGFYIDGIANVYSVSGCISEDFTDYIEYWKHNGHWLFDSPEVIRTVAQGNSIQLLLTRGKSNNSIHHRPQHHRNRAADQGKTVAP